MTALKSSQRVDTMKKILLALGVLLGASAQASEPFLTFLTTSPAASALGGTEIMYCDQSAASTQCTVNQLLTFINANGAPNLSAGTGTVPCGSLPPLTGPITTSGCAATVGANQIANSNLAQMTANTIKGSNTGSTADAGDLTTSQVRTMLGVGLVLTFRYSQPRVRGQPRQRDIRASV